MSDYNLAFELLIKRQLDDFRRVLIPLNDHLWHIFLVVKQKLHEAYFDCLSLWLILVVIFVSFDPYVTVRIDAFLY